MEDHLSYSLDHLSTEAQVVSNSPTSQSLEEGTNLNNNFDKPAPKVEPIKFKLKRKKTLLTSKRKCNSFTGCNRQPCNICKDCREPALQKRGCYRTKCYSSSNSNPSIRRTWRKSVEKCYLEIRMKKLEENIPHLVLPCEKEGYLYPGIADTSYEDAMDPLYSPSMSLLTCSRPELKIVNLKKHTLFIYTSII